jgi:hypothetical protein
MAQLTTAKDEIREEVRSQDGMNALCRREA